MPPGSSSQDTYAVGDLSGKHNMWRKPQNLVQLRDLVWDAFLPLFGPHSVAHRALVLYRENETLPANEQETPSQIPWLCGTLARYDPKDWKVSMFTATAVYRYPVVGRVVLRQPRDEPFADTSVLIEYLVHGDGTSNNNTAEHRWTVNEFPPGRDFYNWSGRCLSAGPVFNPYKVYADPESDSPCLASCRVGELNARHGTLDVAGRKVNGAAISRRLYTDTLLPLSGPGSVLGRSLVLYDDHGPKARGERLACSIIGGEYRRKAVAKDWFGNGKTTPVTGHIEFLQQTEYDVTDIDVDLQGLVLNSGYHVHMTPIEANLEFPCEGSSLYGHWNPRGVSPARSPQPGVGTTDQYEMGDLAGKFGALDNLTSLLAAYNDTDLPLFGPHSVLGRSIIIHKKEKNTR